MSETIRPAQVRFMRACEIAERTDGRRILVHRLSTRAVSNAGARIGERLKSLAPGTEPRRWSGHDRRATNIMIARWCRAACRWRLSARSRNHGHFPPQSLNDRLAAGATAGTCAGSIIALPEMSTSEDGRQACMAHRKQEN